MNDSEVYVSVVICRDVLFDANRLPTALGITNQINAAPAMIGSLTISGGDLPTQQFEKIPTAIFSSVEIAVIVAFYSESEREVAASVQLRKPDGSFAESDNNPTRKALIRPGENGHMFSIKTSLDVSSSGLYWFEVYVDGALRSKCPLRVNHTVSSQSIGSSEAPNDSLAVSQKT